MIKINSKIVEQFTFPGGEVNIRLPVVKPPFNVTAWLQSSDDVMALCLVSDALKRQYDGTIKTLTIPYFPYARQDRVCSTGEALSKQVMINLISSMVSASKIVTYDIHSGSMYPAYTVRSLNDMAESLPFLDDSRLILVAPDEGATRKVNKLANEYELEVLQGVKVRDPVTGNLSGFKMINPDHITGYDLMIVDDICDGGGTFLGLGAEILKYKPASLSLYVTHGIFSKGLDALCDMFDHVYSTDTYLHGLTHPKYTQLEVL